MSLRIIGLSGSLRRTTCPITGSELTSGRDPSNQIYIEDMTLSRRQCVIRLKNGQAILEDLYTATAPSLAEVITFM